MKSDGVHLVRHVQMFQWTEESESESTKKLGGGETTKTTCKYKRDWVDKPVDSGKFHMREGHDIPPMTWRLRQALAPGFRLGAFSMPDTLMRGFGKEESLEVGDEQVAAAQKRTQ